MSALRGEPQTAQTRQPIAKCVAAGEDGRGQEWLATQVESVVFGFLSDSLANSRSVNNAGDRRQTAEGTSVILHARRSAGGGCFFDDGSTENVGRPHSWPKELGTTQPWNSGSHFPQHMQQAGKKYAHHATANPSAINEWRMRTMCSVSPKRCAQETSFPDPSS